MTHIEWEEVEKRERWETYGEGWRLDKKVALVEFEQLVALTRREKNLSKEIEQVVPYYAVQLFVFVRWSVLKTWGCRISSGLT